MGVAIGDHHVATVALIIPIPRHTVALITGVTAIIIQRLTMTPQRELMGGNRLLMDRTARPLEGPVTIRTPEPTLEEHPSRLLMAVEAQHKLTTRTRGPMLRPDKGRVRRLSGAAPMCREVTRALPWAVTQLRMEQWQAQPNRREGKWAAPARKRGETPAAKTASGNMYAGHDGNVYKNTGNGWQKYDNGSWNSVNKPQPNWQGAENGQQRTANESYQQRSSAASSDDRSGSGAGFDRSGAGGFDRSGGGGGFGDLDREAQNRSRGDFSSQRFQSFQGGGFDRFGGSGFGGDRFGGGGFGRVCGGWGRGGVVGLATAGGSGADDDNKSLELSAKFFVQLRTQTTQPKENI